MYYPDSPRKNKSPRADPRTGPVVAAIAGLDDAAALSYSGPAEELAFPAAEEPVLGGPPPCGAPLS
jgi:hypothetical protein